MEQARDKVIDASHRHEQDVDAIVERGAELVLSKCQKDTAVAEERANAHAHKLVEVTQRRDCEEESSLYRRNFHT